MRLVTFDAGEGEGERFGALVDDARVLDLTVAFAWHEAERGRPSDAASVARHYGASLLEFIRHEAQAMPIAADLLNLARAGKLPGSFGTLPLELRSEYVRLLAPIPRPPSMRDGYAFRQHVE